MYRKTFTSLLCILSLSTGCGDAKDKEAIEKELDPNVWTYADSHFHLSNYVGQGGSLRDLLDNYMGTTVGRSTVMAIPLAQKWDYFEHYLNDQTPPTYYLGPKASLYYYSFIDSMIAHEYNKLSSVAKKRFDPMITAFDPMDLYAVQHIKRVLLTNPGVFTGIGEFTVHKEVVSNKTLGDPVAKMAGSATPPDGDDTVTLYNPSLTKILDFTAESGLVTVIHNDIYNAEVTYDGTVVSKAQNDTTYVQGLKSLCMLSPNAKVIWAHTGLGRYVNPSADHVKRVASVLDACPNWSVDLSWDLVQTYILEPKADEPPTSEWVAFMNNYQDRILYGSDNVFYRRTTIDSSTGQPVLGRRQNLEEYSAVGNKYQTLWDQLDPAVARKIQRGNYEALYDAAREKVRAWEAAHADDDIWALEP